MTVSYRRVSQALRIGMALFGAWALYAQIAVLFRADFATLRAFSILPVLGAIAILVCTREGFGLRPSMATGDRDINRSPFRRIPQWCWLLTPFALAGVFELTGSAWLFWILSTVYLFAASRAFSDSSPRPKRDPKIELWEATGLVCLCGIVVLVTLGVIRPDSDDAFLVSLATSALDHPDLALYSFDNVYKSGMPLLEQDLHLAQSYEYFIAVLSNVTKIRVHVLYYVVLPAIWAPVGILVHWIFLRRFLSGRSALVGLAAMVTLLVLWGDGHRTFGNFAFVRLFHGKAIFLLVALPLTVHSALEYRNTPNWKNWLLLMFHQCAAMGFTTNGLTIAPLASALVLLSGAQFNRAFWCTAIRGVAASVPLVFASIGTIYHLRKYAAIDQESAMLLGYQMVLGTQRTSLVLLGLLMLPGLSATAKLRESGWLSNYLFLSFLLVLCPAVSRFFGLNFASVSSWRIFWCLPVPMLLGLAIGAAASKSLPRPSLRAGVLCIFVALFAIAGPSTVNTYNWAWVNIGALKVTEDYGVARHIKDLAPDGSLALVPESVAVNLCGFRDAPPLVAVRSLYLEKLVGLVEEQDLGGRHFLLNYVEGMTSGLTVDWFMDEILSRGVSTIAFQESHPHADALAKSLAVHEFRITRHADHVLAIRPFQAN